MFCFQNNIIQFRGEGGEKGVASSENKIEILNVLRRISDIIYISVFGGEGGGGGVETPLR